MKINWNSVFNHIIDNRTAIGVYGIGIATAAFKVWPTPDKIWLTKQTFKDFFYDFTHQQFNITNTRSNKNDAVKTDTPVIPENGQK